MARIIVYKGIDADGIDGGVEDIFIAFNSKDNKPHPFELEEQWALEDIQLEKSVDARDEINVASVLGVIDSLFDIDNGVDAAIEEILRTVLVKSLTPAVVLHAFTPEQLEKMVSEYRSLEEYSDLRKLRAGSTEPAT